MNTTETTKDYTYQNAEPVLEKVEAYINYLEAQKQSTGFNYRLDFRGVYENAVDNERTVYDNLSIFDWWPDKLSISHLKSMRSFLKEAIKLGYTGYVCFKVGATGCANGMWAHVKESTNGYSPDGDCIYRSFTPDYVRWDFKVRGFWYFDVLRQLGIDSDDDIKTVKEMEEKLANFKRLVATIDENKEV